MRSAATLLGSLCALASCQRGASVERPRAPAAPVVAAPAPRPPAPAARAPWLRGQLHAHSNRSGDSQTPPEDVVRWYAEHGWDFVVHTDHNVATRPRPSPRPEMLVFSGVELTWNARTCGPPEAPCNLHVNALFAEPPAEDRNVELTPQDPQDRASIYRHELALAAGMGALGQLNHPNYHYGAGAEVLEALAREGLRLVEFSNASDGCQNEGDATHPNTEALWDQLTERGVDLWNVATDDAHHYYDAEALRARGETVYTPELGWVMVRAARERGALREALSRGEFYASTGPRIEELSAAGGALRLTLGGASASAARVRFVVSPGRELRVAQGPSVALSFDELPADTRWVRAVVEDAAGHRAWTQPVRLARAGTAWRSQGPFGDVPAPAAPSAPATPALPAPPAPTSPPAAEPPGEGM